MRLYLRFISVGTGWSGEVRSIVFSADGSTVSVVYRVTIKGSDGEVAWTHHSSFFPL
jgi:hypothetical protein